MYAQVEKSKENKSRAVAQKKNGIKQGFGFVDNRPGAKHAIQLHAMAENYSVTQQQSIQKKENDKKGITLGPSSTLHQKKRDSSPFYDQCGRTNTQTEKIDSSPLQLAGDPQGMLPQHPTGGISFTFHHIVPENLLKAAWDKVKDTQAEAPDTNLLADPEADDTMLAGFQATLTKGYSTFYNSAVSNIRKDLLREFSPDYLNYLRGEAIPSEESVREMVVKLCDPDNEEIVTSTDAARLIMSDEHQGDLADVRDSFNKWTKAVDVTEDTAKSIAISVSDNKTLEHMIEWLPGNIHRGPTARIAPGGAGFDSNIDDGGDSFEDSAVHLVGGEHWAALLLLKTAIANVTEEASLDNIQGLSAALTALSEFGMTDYNPEKWRECDQDGREGKYEIIPA